MCCYTEAVPLDMKPAVKKTEITYEELSKLVDAGTLHLFDVREPADVIETGIIKSAINIPCMIYARVLYIVFLLCSACPCMQSAILLCKDVTFKFFA